MKTLQFLFMKQEKVNKSISGVCMRRILPRFETLNIEMSIMELKRYIYQSVKYLYKSNQDMTEDEEINDKIIIHVYDNLPRERYS